MVSTKKYNRKTKRVRIVVATLVLLLIAGGAATWLWHSRDDSPPAATSKGGIDHSPATAAEQKSADEQKTAFADSQNEQHTNNTPSSNTDSSSGMKTASVYITYAQQNGDIIDINAYTDQYQNGSCTITLTKGASRVTKEVAAYTDASTTICNNPRFTRSNFPSGGDWLATVTFTSSTATGISQSQIVTIN